MSVTSWKKEFYNTAVSRVSKISAVAHSLKKWSGLTEKNLKKHGVGPGELRVNSDTCALCNHYLNNAMKGSNCRKCPLSIVRGGVRCDATRDEEKESPYMTFILEHDPSLMIAWLRVAKAYVEQFGAP